MVEVSDQSGTEEECWPWCVESPSCEGSPPGVSASTIHCNKNKHISIHIKVLSLMFQYEINVLFNKSESYKTV